MTHPKAVRNSKLILTSNKQSPQSTCNTPGGPPGIHIESRVGELEDDVLGRFSLVSEGSLWIGALTGLHVPNAARQLCVATACLPKLREKSLKGPKNIESLPSWKLSPSALERQMHLVTQCAERLQADTER